MSHAHPESHAARTVALAATTWGLVAAGVAASRMPGEPGGVAALATALALGAIAGFAYVADDELRTAARATPRRILLRWAVAFDVAAILLVGLAAASAAPFAKAVWMGLPAMAVLFAAPMAAVFHLAALDGRPWRSIRLSAPARSPARSPAGT